MLVSLVDKILVLLFFLSLLNVVRHGFLILQIILSKEAKRYTLPSNSLLIAWISVAYIFTTIFCGITL